MKFSRIEINHLLRAWLIISIAFAIAFKGLGEGLLVTITISLFAVGAGFVFHELAHKYFAQKYGCWAEFRANNFMLMIALVFSFFGFIFAAPGGVVLKGNITKRKIAYISMAGPLTNLILGVLFGALSYFAPITQAVALPGMMINFWLGMFNALPLPMFDGHKVYRWSKVASIILLIFAIALTFGSGQLLATLI